MKKELIEKILSFIKRRWQRHGKEQWKNGNCYWFAHILSDEFDNLQIYYCPVSGHFIAGDLGVFFDIDGMIDLSSLDKKEKIYLLSDIEKNDDLWFSHLMRDCKD